MRTSPSASSLSLQRVSSSCRLARMRVGARCFLFGRNIACRWRTIALYRGVTRLKWTGLRRSHARRHVDVGRWLVNGKEKKTERPIYTCHSDRAAVDRRRARECTYCRRDPRPQKKL